MRSPTEPLTGSSCISVLGLLYISLSYCNNNFLSNKIRKEIGAILSVDRWTCVASISLGTPRLMPKPGSFLPVFFCDHAPIPDLPALSRRAKATERRHNHRASCSP